MPAPNTLTVPGFCSDGAGAHARLGHKWVEIAKLPLFIPPQKAVAVSADAGEDADMLIGSSPLVQVC